MCRVPSICPRLPELSVRPVCADDRLFLINVYANSREERSITNWIDGERQTCLAQRFTEQQCFYQQHFPNAAFDLILLCDKPIGRIYTDRFADEIRILDLALLPEHRNHKIGTAFLQAVRAEARCLGRAIRLYMDRFSRAIRLYTRLGFQPISWNGTAYLLEWRP